MHTSLSLEVQVNSQFYTPSILLRTLVVHYECLTISTLFNRPCFAFQSEKGGVLLDLITKTDV